MISQLTKLIGLVLILLFPFSTSANYFTLPADDSPISSWFDHDGDTSTTMTKYTGEIYSTVEADIDT